MSQFKKSEFRDEHFRWKALIHWFSSSPMVQVNSTSIYLVPSLFQEWVWDSSLKEILLLGWRRRQPSDLPPSSKTPRSDSDRKQWVLGEAGHQGGDLWVWVTEEGLPGSGWWERETGRSEKLRGAFSDRKMERRCFGLCGTLGLGELLGGPCEGSVLGLRVGNCPHPWERTAHGVGTPSVR